MLTTKTVFILGAGAHCDLGMPLGEQLAQIISRMTLVETDSINSISRWSDGLQSDARNSDLTMTTAVKAAQKMHRGISLSPSIDNFLDLHKDDDAVVKLGKMAIARAILRREGLSLLATTNREWPDFAQESFVGAWQIKLIKLLSRKPAKDAFENIAFVSFNYDRCLERFLLFAIASLHSIPLAEAATIVKGIKIFHPYGMTGQIPELGGSTAFGLEGDGYVQPMIWDKIKTYTEEIAISDHLQAMHDQLSSAETIVFLGFAFHEQNLKILAKIKPLTGGDMTNGRFTKIYATATGISDPGVEVMKRRIAGIFSDQSSYNVISAAEIRNDLNCSQMFEYYGPTFSEL